MQNCWLKTPCTVEDMIKFYRHCGVDMDYRWGKMVTNIGIHDRSYIGIGCDFSRGRWFYWRRFIEDFKDSILFIPTPYSLQASIF